MFIYLGGLKFLQTAVYIYIYIYWAFIQKEKFSGPLPQQGFCTFLQIWDELGATSQTKQGFFFLPFQEPLILNIRFSLPFLDLVCYVSESFLESPILYLAFFKTILTTSKPSFLHNHFTTQHSDFSCFLTVSTKDKLVNRSIHAYALM